MSEEARDTVRRLVGQGASLAAAARVAGVSASTAGRIVAPATVAAVQAAVRPRKPKPPLPRDFDAAYLAHAFAPPVDITTQYAWRVPTIHAVRDEHMRGEFCRSAALIAAMKTCAPIYSSLLNRIAPPSGLSRRIVGAEDERGEQIRREAALAFGRRSVAFSPGVLSDAFETQAMAGLFVGQNVWTTREDGSRRDVCIEPWPLEAVSVDGTTGALTALTCEGPVSIVHGDGKWVVARLHHTTPWRWGAIVALAGLWPDNAFAKRDRSQAAEAHGQIKPIGTLPEGVPIDSDEGRFMVRMMQAFQRSRSGGLKPFGSTIEFPSSDSAAWQIFRDIIGNSGSEIAKILLGQDATSGLGKDAPGVGPALFGVRNDIVERDIRDGMEPALTLGTLRPWTAINFGRVDAHPAIQWDIPDADEDARVASLAARTTSFQAALDGYKRAGFVVDQALVDELAVEFKVRAPELAASVQSAADFFQYDLELGVVTINEARARRGLPPLEGGDRTVPQIRAEEAAAASRQETAA